MTATASCHTFALYERHSRGRIVYHANKQARRDDAPTTKSQRSLTSEERSTSEPFNVRYAVEINPASLLEIKILFLRSGVVQMNTIQEDLP